MRFLPSLLLCLLLAHVLVGLGRVPHAVAGRRLDEIAAVHRLGYVDSVFQQAHLEGADAVTALLASVPSDGVVAVRGAFKGALEYAVALLWPRLCVRADQIHGDRFADRAVAGRVLVGDGMSVRLEPR